MVDVYNVVIVAESDPVSIGSVGDTSEYFEFFLLEVFLAFRAAIAAGSLHSLCQCIAWSAGVPASVQYLHGDDGLIDFGSAAGTVGAGGSALSDRSRFLRLCPPLGGSEGGLPCLDLKFSDLPPLGLADLVGFT